MRYMIITYVQRPNGQMDERVEVSNRVKNRDINTASVILDFKNNAVIKASVGSQSAPRDFDRIRDFYAQHYPNVIEQITKATSEKSDHTG